jgi:hypothetical protein
VRYGFDGHLLDELRSGNRPGEFIGVRICEPEQWPATWRADEFPELVTLTRIGCPFCRRAAQRNPVLRRYVAAPDGPLEPLPPRVVKEIPRRDFL